YALALVVTCLISQYILLHDLSILVLSAILLAGYFTKSSPGRGWGTVRVGLAVVWAVCWLGPVLTVYIRVPLVPLALVLLAWTAWNGLPKGIPGYIRVRLLAPRGPAGADPGPDRLGIFH
ncbi:MAG TPA: hypothetical protein VFZ25_21145, partial [Chloroflexota bacterium]|nr:hypothetical protein [Chloroflexota bacterium]